MVRRRSGHAFFWRFPVGLKRPRSQPQAHIAIAEPSVASPMFHRMLGGEDGVFAVPGCSIKARIPPAIIGQGPVLRAGLSVLRPGIADPRDKRGDVGAVVFQLAPFGRGGLFRQADAGPPLVARTDRARHEPAAAVRADVRQQIVENGF